MKRYLASLAFATSIVHAQVYPPASGGNGTGTQGPAGPAGANGSTINYGNGAPASTIGNNGDSYIDLTNNLFYAPKASGAWPATGKSIVGPQGVAGATGATGSQGPIGATGATGAQGVAGAAGATGAVGATGALGVAGFQGATGATGATGSQGPVGPAPSGTGLVVVNNGVPSTVAAAPASVGADAAGAAATALATAQRTANIAAWGDSLTFGNQDGTGPSYPGYLQRMLARHVDNWGIPGQTSPQIAGRFLNANAGEYNDFTIIFAGRNDLGASYTNAQTMTNIANMVAALPAGSRYVVLTVPTAQLEISGSYNYNYFTGLNSSIKSTYPNNSLDILSLLIADYNPNSQPDVLNNQAGEVPVSLHATIGTGTLTTAVTSATSCAITISGSFVANGGAGVGDILLVNGEYIVVTATSGSNTVTGCTRGYGSTAAASYSVGQAYSLIDNLHLGANGYQFVATQLASYIAAHDSVAGAQSSTFWADNLKNLYIGDDSFQSNTSGQGNTVFGLGDMQYSTTAGSNSIYGYYTGQSLTTGSFNSVFGNAALQNATTAGSNNVIGQGAMFNDTTGSNNSAIGNGALYRNTTGQNNNGIGLNVLFNDATGTGNDGFGTQALFNATNSANDAFGYKALNLLTSGTGNLAFGYLAGLTPTSANADTTGSYNTFLGWESGFGSATQQTYQADVGAGATGTCSSCVVLGRLGTDSTYTTALRSGSAANTDLSGELALSAATTASYTFTAAYTSHPEVSLQCQFNCNGNQPWVTYTGTTAFTVNFATAATGTVTYTISGRN